MKLIYNILIETYYYVITRRFNINSLSLISSIIDEHQNQLKSSLGFTHRNGFYTVVASSSRDWPWHPGDRAFSSVSTVDSSVWAEETAWRYLVAPSSCQPCQSSAWCCERHQQGPLLRSDRLCCCFAAGYRHFHSDRLVDHRG